MKKYLIVASVALAIIAALVILLLQNKRLRRERDAYRNNTEVLLGEIERYETKSGEQAVRVGELQLRVAELERYRADDAALIKDMGIGMLCGSMANPMALSYANTTVEGDEPSVSYATVYPLSMFIRVISAQLLIMLFT